MGKEYRLPGRPKAVETPEEWDAAVAGYLAEQEEKGERPLLTGVMLALGIYEYRNFYAYEKRPEFRESFSRVRAIVTAAYEKCLHGGGSSQGAQFALKNIKDTDGLPAWQDKHEVNVTGNLDVQINIAGWQDDGETEE